MYRVLAPLFIILPLALALPIFIEVYLSPESRIVGGKDTTIEEYPHQVSIVKYGGHYCGGSIISKTFIVTAAHCTYLAESKEYSVRVNTSLVDDGGVVHKVKTIYNHPKYSGEEDYDISVLELAEPIKFTEGAKPIALPDKSDRLVAGKVVEVTGWGNLKSGGPSPDVLQVVEVPIVDHDVCVEAYKEERFPPVTENMLCAGYIGEGGKDSCQGDSGGPLVADGKLYGVVSWGEGCALPQYPGLYADVAYFRDFIKEITGV